MQASAIAVKSRERERVDLASANYSLTVAAPSESRTCDCPGRNPIRKLPFDPGPAGPSLWKAGGYNVVRGVVPYAVGCGWLQVAPCRSAMAGPMGCPAFPSFRRSSGKVQHRRSRVPHAGEDGRPLRPVKHGRCAMADRFRVRIDLDRIQANVLAYEGGRLSELQIRNWLRSVGFTPNTDGTWVAEEDCLDRLHRTEILELPSRHRRCRSICNSPHPILWITPAGGGRNPNTTCGRGCAQFWTDPRTPVVLLTFEPPNKQSSPVVRSA